MVLRRLEPDFPLCGGWRRRLVGRRAAAPRTAAFRGRPGEGRRPKAAQTPCHVRSEERGHLETGGDRLQGVNLEAGDRL
jgi:hypothetical protein